MRSYFVVFLAVVGASADTSGCVTDASGLQSCHGDTPIGDATSMLQITNFKRRNPCAGLPPDKTEDAANCPFLTDAMWAAMDTYVEVAYNPMMAQPGSEAFCFGDRLRSAFWKLEASWVVVNKTTPDELAGSAKYYGMLNDTDYTGLWIKEDSCLLAFRGSDSQIDVGILPNVPEEYQQYGTKPGAPNGVQWSAVEFHGLQVHLGVKVELEALLAKMQSTEGLATIKNKCKKLALTGHSLGGGTSQLLATLLNKNGDPLGAGLTVDHVLGFGPMPFVKDTPAVNDKSSDGCFAGGMYANVAGKDDAGVPIVDLVWQMLTTTPGLQFRHVKTAHNLMVGPGDYIVTPCGDDPPYPYTGKSVKVKDMMPTHSQSLYAQNVGCPMD